MVCQYNMNKNRVVKLKNSRTACSRHRRICWDEDNSGPSTHTHGHVASQAHIIEILEHMGCEEYMIVA